MKIRVEVSSLATHNISGVASYTRLLAEALAGGGNEVYAHYFNFMNRQPEPVISAKVYREKNRYVPLRIHAKLDSYGVAPAFDMSFPRVDLTIFPNFATWPSVKSRLTATVIHDLTYLYYPELVEEKNLAHLRRVVPRSIRKADFIITVSESVKEEIVKEFSVAPDNIVVTPIPPSDIFRVEHSSAEINEILTKYDLVGKKYIFFMGNFEPRKNLKTLIEAYCKLPPKIQGEYALILAGGKGWKSKETQKTLDDAIASGKNVRHIGFIEDTDRPALYQAASLFVMPSHYEGFGIPVLEAMLSGCPVVAGDIPVLRETGGKAALYASPDSDTDLSKVIHSALKKYPYSHEDMIKNVDRFSWQKNVDLIINKTQKLLDK